MPNVHRLEHDTFALATLADLSSVSINTSLISDADSTDDLGSSTIAWANLYVDNISGTASGVLVINEAGDNVDFRVEGDANANLFFVDGGTNTVSFFTTAISTIALYSNPSFTVSGSSNNRGMFSNFFVQDTTGTDFTGDAIALYGRSRVQAGNTSDWTGTVGLRGVMGENVLITPSSGTYTVTGGAAFYVMNATAQSSTTLTNQYGVYFEDLTAGATDYGLFFAGNPSGGSMASASNIDISIMPGGTGDVGINTTSPVCNLDVNGGFAVELVSKTANYTATSSDHTILCGSGNETFTVTLPAASGVSGIIYNIKNIGTGIITVDGNASETIDGGTTATLNAQFESISIHCDGSNWHII